MLKYKKEEQLYTYLTTHYYVRREWNVMDCTTKFFISDKDYRDLNVSFKINGFIDGYDAYDTDEWFQEIINNKELKKEVELMIRRNKFYRHEHFELFAYIKDWTFSDDYLILKTSKEYSFKIKVKGSSAKHVIKFLERNGYSAVMFEKCRYGALDMIDIIFTTIENGVSFLLDNKSVDDFIFENYNKCYNTDEFAKFDSISSVNVDENNKLIKLTTY